MKTNQTLPTLAIFCCFLISSCIYYNTLPVNGINQKTIKDVTEFRPLVTIETANVYQLYSINNYKIENDSIYGSLERIPYSYHMPKQTTFRARGNKAPLSTTHLLTSRALEPGPVAISINEIVGAEIHDVNVGLSTLVTTGTIVGSTVVGGTTFLLIACSCPHVYTYTPEGDEVFHGSVFPGAIAASLTRDDYLVLNHVKADKNNQLKVSINNELPEIQYLDHIQLQAVQTDQQHVGTLNTGELVTYNDGIAPQTVYVNNGKHYLSSIEKLDNVTYQFDQVGNESELNSIELNFDVSSIKDKALLTINGKQTEQLEQTAEWFFQQFGSSFSNWVDDLNSADPKKYKSNAIDQGISMNVYIKKDGEWVYHNSFENIGTMAYKDFAMEIDLTDLGDQLSIKLEAAYGFWSLDRVQLTDNFNTSPEVTDLGLAQATNQAGEDVSAALESVDQNYVVQDSIGQQIHLTYDIPSNFDAVFVLKGNGYYNHLRDYEMDMNKKALRHMKKTPLSTHVLSRRVALYKAINQAVAQK